MDEASGAAEFSSAPKAGRRARRKSLTQYDPGAMDIGGSEPPATQEGGLFGRMGTGIDGGMEAPAPRPPSPRMQDDEAAVQTFQRPMNGQATSSMPSSLAPRAAPAAAALDPLADLSGKKFTGLSRRKQEQVQTEREEAEMRTKSKYDQREVAETLLDIPELEEQGKEDLTRVVAAAPKVRGNKVQELAELDEELHFKLPKNEDREIDLSLLTSVLCSLEQVTEEEVPWTTDQLFTDVASELHSEQERGQTEQPDAAARPMTAAVGAI